MTLNTESLTNQVKQLKKEVDYLKNIVLNRTSTYTETHFEYTSYLDHAATEIAEYKKQIPSRY